MGIVRFALRFPHTFYVMAALIMFLGVAAIRTMPTDIFPQIDIPVVTVIWQYTGLSTPEMEQRVTTYSQYSMSSNVTGIKNIEAQTLNGLSVQKVYFQPDVNLDLAIAQIVSATNAIRALMPAGIQPPIVVQYNASSVPVLQLSVRRMALRQTGSHASTVPLSAPSSTCAKAMLDCLERCSITGLLSQLLVS
jgi:multidrug efflux pump subunit AcrB